MQTALQNFRQTLAKAKRALTNPAGWDGVALPSAEATQLVIICYLMGAALFVAVSS